MYKNVRAARAMERTKPINQNKQQKNHNSGCSTATERILRLKPFSDYFQRKYKEVQTRRDSSIHSLLGKIYIKKCKRIKVTRKRSSKADKVAFRLRRLGLGGEKRSGVISGGKPVLMSKRYWPKAHVRLVGQ